MALPSQTARPVSRRTYTHRRSRRRRSRAIIFVVFVVAALVAWWFWSQKDAANEPALDDAPKAPVAANVTTAPRGENGDKARGGTAKQPGAGTSAQGRTAPPAESAKRPLTETRQPPAIEMGGAAPDRGAEKAQPPVVEKLTPAAPTAPAATARETGAGAGAEPAAAQGAGAQPSSAKPPAASSGAPAAAPSSTARPPANTEPAPFVPAAAPAAAKASPATARAQEQVRVGLDLLARNEPVEARLLLTRALDSGSLGDADEEVVRDRLAALNQRLVFGPDPVPGDQWVDGHEVASGESLSGIQRSRGVHTEWQFIQRINRISKPERIAVGQKLKIVTGPFHAVIHKRTFRLDLYLGDGATRVFVCSLPVGLGENDSTPEGRFRVRPRSKLENPEWINPRTRERYGANDPRNPIGERWIGLIGDEEHLRDVEGYGIHGTIEPDSIGRQASMGCVRMLPDDVAIVYEVLVEKMSTIEIRP